jgi:uncharacterized protein YbaR (Trm112 family)
MNKAFFIDSPFFLFFKKHLCPGCEQMLEVKKVSKVVNSKSPEAKDLVFSVADGSLCGDVKFTYYEFYCASCRKYYSINEIIKYEKQGRKGD